MRFYEKLPDFMKQNGESRLEEVLEWLRENPLEVENISIEDINVLAVMLTEDEYDEFVEEMFSITSCANLHELVPESVTGDVFIRLTVCRYYGVIPEVEITMN